MDSSIKKFFLYLIPSNKGIHSSYYLPCIWNSDNKYFRTGKKTFMMTYFS